MFAILILVLFLVGCDATPFDLFVCTQEAVCQTAIDRSLYVFLEHGQDTGIVVPGLRQNFVPQGIAYWPERNWFLLSGYFAPVSQQLSSVILAVDGRTGKMTGEYTLQDLDGKTYNGHFSGVTVGESDLFVTGSYCLYRIPLGEFARVGRKGSLQVSQELSVSTAAASCVYANGILWVGEHYHAKAYPLKGEHVMRGNDGQIYSAWLIGYQITKQGELTPCAVYSIPDRIQGVAVSEDGKVVLSQSYGRTNPSAILIYQNPHIRQPDAWVQADGLQVPLWFLDSTNGVESMDAPPMAEGCCYVDGFVYVIFESAAYFYRAFMPENPSLHPIDSIWKLEIKK